MNFAGALRCAAATHSSAVCLDFNPVLTSSSKRFDSVRSYSFLKKGPLYKKHKGSFSYWLCGVETDPTYDPTASVFGELGTKLKNPLSHKVSISCLYSGQQATDLTDLFAAFKTRKQLITAVSPSLHPRATGQPLRSRRCQRLLVSVAVFNVHMLWSLLSN